MDKLSDWLENIWVALNSQFDRQKMISLLKYYTFTEPATMNKVAKDELEKLLDW